MRLLVSILARELSGAREMARVALFLLLVCALTNAEATPSLAATRSSISSSAQVLSERDQAFLEELEQRIFRFFWEQANPQTGLVLDRSKTNGSPSDERHRYVASIASTGFGLTALCIAAERHWVTPAEARARARNTLRFFAARATQEHGWFYHWMNTVTGEREWNSEVSSIDTALLLGGVLTARQCFRDDKEIVRLAQKIYERVDFHWMLNGHPTLLSHGWRPETGFIKSRWDNYSEHLILQLLAIGSSTHPITPRAWRAWKRTWITYQGYHYLTSAAPLFIHQYSHAWVDFRQRRENRYPYTDYFANSVAATRAHRAFCLNLSHEFPSYSENVWGITASDSSKGYVAWGGPPREEPAIDGTVVPSAAGGSLMFTPDISLAALQTMRERYGERIYGRYGFTDAFNPITGWIGPDVIGINVGIMLLSAENLRTGNVWRWFMRNREITRAMHLVGLRRVGERKRLSRLRKSAAVDNSRPKIDRSLRLAA